MRHVQFQIGQQAAGVLELLLSFAREADDHVRADRNAGDARADNLLAAAHKLLREKAQLLSGPFRAQYLEKIPWHRHSKVADYYYGLEGRVVVETREPAARHELGAGQAATVAPATVHQVSNPAKSPCRFLLIQGVGQYDFIREE